MVMTIVMLMAMMMVMKMIYSVIDNLEHSFQLLVTLQVLQGVLTAKYQYCIKSSWTPKKNGVCS